MHEADGDDGLATLDLPEWSRLLRLARLAERGASIPGLASFLVAKAKQVSDGVTTALHGGTLGAAAFDEHRRDPALQAYFEPNPWWPRTPEGDELAQRWTFLGGWFGLPPAVALTTADGSARRHDPAYVFVPPFAVAYATDRVVRLAQAGSPPTWLELWRRWAAGLPAIGYPPSRRNDSLHDSLRRSARRGADLAIVDQAVRVQAYPGFVTLLRQLREGELKLVRG